MLEVDNIQVNYGAVSAIRGLSFELGEGEIVAILGANGAGKTTTLRAISHTIHLASGEVRFEGCSINCLPPHEIVKLGISHCPEGRRIFPDLTVLENLVLGGYCVNDRHHDGTLQHVYHYFPRLADRKQQKGGTLSGGEQQMLAIGRALMNKPRLLMLDEPSLGLAPLIVDRIFEIIRTINKEDNVTILIVEQNANEALQHSNRAYILENGRIVMTGDSRELLHDDKVKAAYLGG